VCGIHCTIVHKHGVDGVEIQAEDVHKKVFKQRITQSAIICILHLSLLQDFAQKSTAASQEQQYW